MGERREASGRGGAWRSRDRGGKEQRRRPWRAQEEAERVGELRMRDSDRDARGSEEWDVGFSAGR